ncbi:hypothetical protein V7148_08965 [Gottfriedia acidiceleris]|uniref:hypothetical protein n=1 Tax=Bacillaceae TaxID=186817 RepID=UPI000BF97082|nr:hypothetical protein [Bacillus sp. AFS077874]
MGLAGRLRPHRLAEEAKESRPMESEHPAMEINITLLLLRKFGNLIDNVVFQQHENVEEFSSTFFLHTKMNVGQK